LPEGSFREDLGLIALADLDKRANSSAFNVRRSPNGEEAKDLVGVPTQMMGDLIKATYDVVTRGFRKVTAIREAPQPCSTPSASSCYKDANRK